MSFAFQGTGNAFQRTGFAFQQELSQTEQQVTGGWEHFLLRYEHELASRRKRKRELEELEEERELIEDQQTREIARLLSIQEAKDEKRKELDRLSALAKQADAEREAMAYNERIGRAYMRAVLQQNFSALEALDRELRRDQEEQEFLTMSILLILDDE